MTHTKKINHKSNKNNNKIYKKSIKCKIKGGGGGKDDIITPDKTRQILEHIKQNISNVQNVLRMTKDHFKSEMERLSNNPEEYQENEIVLKCLKKSFEFNNAYALPQNAVYPKNSAKYPQNYIPPIPLRTSAPVNNISGGPYIEPTSSIFPNVYAEPNTHSETYEMLLNEGAFPPHNNTTPFKQNIKHPGKSAHVNAAANFEFITRSPSQTKKPPKTGFSLFGLFGKRKSRKATPLANLEKPKRNPLFNGNNNTGSRRLTIVPPRWEPRKKTDTLLTRPIIGTNTNSIASQEKYGFGSNNNTPLEDE